MTGEKETEISMEATIPSVVGLLSTVIEASNDEYMNAEVETNTATAKEHFGGRYAKPAAMSRDPES